MALATQSVSSDGNPLNDAYGTVTATANTAWTLVIYPHTSARTIISSWGYETGADAQNLVFLCPMDSMTVITEGASGAATLKVDHVPTNFDGSAIASGDYFLVRYDDGSLVPLLYSSISGTTITFTTNLAQDVQIGTTVYYMGAPGDWTTRTWRMSASTKLWFPGGDFRDRKVTTAEINQPILLYCANATSQSYLLGVGWFYE